MKIGITYRLFLAILAAASLAVVCMFFIMRMSIDRGFLHYINSLEQTRLVRLAERLEVNYAEEGSWEALRLAPDRWQRLVDTSLPEEEGPPAGRERRDEPPGPPPPDKETTADRPLPPQPGQGFELRVMLLDAGRRPVFAPATIPVTLELKPLHYRDHVVGYLGLLPRRQLSDIRQQRFVKQQKFALAAVAGMVVLVAAALSLPLANRLVRPIRALAAAANRMASGQFDARVAVTSTDELGQLARDFNELALSLEKNEQVRRQWVADISHELRTPLAVLRAEIEALQDGVRQLSPESIHSLHGEVLRISRLVDDLYQLSLSDVGALTYRKEELDLTELLDEALAAFGPEFTQKGITLTAHIPRDGRAVVFGDPARLHQLFANLLDNALKYTDSGGELIIRLVCDEARARLDFQDTAPGVSPYDLERLFDRLYRVEASRNRAAGGAGLGLAICRNIVEAHAGTITAQPSPLGGVRIILTLPLQGGYA